MAGSRLQPFAALALSPISAPHFLIMDYFPDQCEAKGTLRDALPTMAAAGRMELLASLFEGYCLHCGSEFGAQCCCTRDD